MIKEPRKLSRRVFRLDTEEPGDVPAKQASNMMFHIHIPNKNVPVQKENIIAKAASAFEHKEKLPRTPDEDKHSKQLAHNVRARSNNGSHSAPKRKPRRNFAVEHNSPPNSTARSLFAEESHLTFEIEVLESRDTLFNARQSVIASPRLSIRRPEERDFNRNSIVYDMSRYEPPRESPREVSPAEQQRIYEIESKAIYFQNLEMRRYNRQRNTCIHLTGTCQRKSNSPSPTIQFPVTKQNYSLGDYVSDMDNQFWSYENLKHLDTVHTPHQKPTPQKSRHNMPSTPPVSTEYEECAICLDNIEQENATLSCKHHFHVRCIEKWLVEHKTCPVCRALCR
jgi:hypothetical protein